MRTRPLQPPAFAPQPVIVDPGGGSAARNVISVGPVRGPTTTPLTGVGVGLGAGVGTTIGVAPSPQPSARRAARTGRDPVVALERLLVRCYTHAAIHCVLPHDLPPLSGARPAVVDSVTRRSCRGCEKPRRCRRVTNRRRVTRRNTR